MPHWKVQTNHNTEGTIIEADTGDLAVAGLGTLSEGDYIRGVTQVEAPTPIQHETHVSEEPIPTDQGEGHTISPEETGTPYPGYDDKEGASSI